MPASAFATIVALRLPDGTVLRITRVPEHAFTALPTLPVLTGDAGLAYVVSPARRVGFWTVGFEAPVDQVFIAANGRVVQVFEARAPAEGELIGPVTVVALVLELPAGASRRLGILPGARLVEVEGDPVTQVLDAAADPGFVAIVQSDRAGWFLACELRRRGYRVAHVHHTRHLDEVGEDEFDLELVYGDDLDEVLPALTELGPCLVLAGSELGVNPADYLAEALRLPGNGTLHSVARRDKAGMVEALRAAGIPVMRQLRSRSWKRIVRWMERHQLREVVIKPVHSAGTDRVARARTADEVRQATRAIVGVTNRLGLREVEVVAQERLFGPEIYLNSVSRAGRHAVTEIWLEKKRLARGGGEGAAPFAYDTFELQEGDDVLAGYLRAWLERVLDALGLAWGPAHTELILTPEGPRLIDFGARLDGVLLPSLNEECIGQSPVQITADAYLDPAAWHAWAATPYRLRQRATMVVVDNPCAGILRDDSGLRSIARLPTFHALRPRWGVGEQVPATVDAFSYHAIITLRDADLTAVECDHAHIRALEAAELLLDVTPAAPAPNGPARTVDFADPRALDAWGEALEAFGWTTVRDPATGLLGRLRAELDGLLLWVPRQPHALSLSALERLRLASDAHRVVVELTFGARIEPLVGSDVVLTQWDPDAEAALERIGLTPTMHLQAPPLIELAPATDAERGVVVRAIVDAVSAQMVAPAFRELGLGDAARWPAALGASLAGQVPCALAVLEEGDVQLGAALGLVHGGHVHVPVVSARQPGDNSDLRRLALALGAHFGLSVIAPGTGISRGPGGVAFDLPPALRWKRPTWAEHLPTLDGIEAAVGLALAPSRPGDNDVLARFALREHPLALWGGAAIGQALGRAPVWARTAMLFREAAGVAPHGVVPHAPCIDLEAFDAIAVKQDLLWIGWEPPPAGGDVIAPDGSVHRLDWHDPARALHEAAALGLYPVRARWTPRKTFVLDLAAIPDSSFDIAPSPAPRVTFTPIGDLTPGDWDRLDGLDDACPAPARTIFPHPRRVARGLALGLGNAALCALAEDGDGILSYTFCLLHDRVAWSLLGNTHPRAAPAVEPYLRLVLMRHARSAGCDLMDLHGAWDERFPDEHLSWRGLPSQGHAGEASTEALPRDLRKDGEAWTSDLRKDGEASTADLRAHLHPVYYPPTLARFRG